MTPFMQAEASSSTPRQQAHVVPDPSNDLHADSGAFAGMMQCEPSSSRLPSLPDSPGEYWNLENFDDPEYWASLDELQCASEHQDQWRLLLERLVGARSQADREEAFRQLVLYARAADPDGYFEKRVYELIDTRSTNLEPPFTERGSGSSSEDTPRHPHPPLETIASAPRPVNRVVADLLENVASLRTGPRAGRETWYGLKGDVEREHKLALLAYQRNLSSRTTSLLHNLTVDRTTALNSTIEVSSRVYPPVAHAGWFRFIRTYTGGKTYHSVTPVASLERITLKDMKVPMWHRGKLLICRVLTPVLVGTGLSFMAEDQDGKVVRVVVMHPSLVPTPFLSQQAAEGLYPVDAYLAIREPYAKWGVRGAVIRIEVPSDIARFHPDAELLRGVRFRFPTAKPFRATFEEIKAQGNAAMKAKDYATAMERYTFGLTLPREALGPAGEFVLRLNRIQASLCAKQWGAAWGDFLLAHALCDRENCPTTLKQLDKLNFRGLTAMYYVRLFEDVLDMGRLSVQLLLEGSKEIVEKAQQRVRERDKGSYNWKEMIRTIIKNPDVELDVADYQQPVRIYQVSGRGRGVFTTRAVRRGELLMVSKPLVWVIPKEGADLEVACVNFHTKMFSGTAQHIALHKAIYALIDVPSLRKGWGRLRHHDKLQDVAGVARDQFGNSFVDVDAMEIPIDVARLERNILFNGVSAKSIGRVQRDGHAQMKENSRAMSFRVYGLSSMINHSCLPNVTVDYWGDVQVIRALRDLGARTELVAPVFSSRLKYSRRQELSEARGIPCTCGLCAADAKDDTTTRDKLIEQLPIFVQRSKAILRRPVVPAADPENRRFLSDLMGFKRELEDTYGPTRRWRIEYHVVCRMWSDHTSFSDVDTAILAETTGLHCLGVKLSSDLKTAMLGRMIEEIGPLGCDAQVYGCINLAFLHSQLPGVDEERRDEVVVAWLKTAAWVHDMTIGGGVEVFRMRFEEHLRVFKRYSSLGGTWGLGESGPSGPGR